MTNVILLQPVASNTSLKDHTHRVLRKAILDVDIYDRSTELKLDERQLADGLGVSRTPLREALVRLEQEGLVEIRARKGVYLKRRGCDEVVEMVTVWAALESMAARLACERASDDDIGRLRRIGDKYTLEKAKAKLSEYSEANIEFHRMIMSMSKCAVLERHAEDLFDQLKPVRRGAMRDSSRTNRSVVDHSNIIEAISSRDFNRAGDLVRDHTLRLGEYIRRSWQFLDREIDRR
ncbi:MAG: GntR family transcriptional regulator [Rhodobacteraceae bacterium]|nr:GntR family transcriptional regulator [Paracoccaceae bacterium]